MKFAVSTTAFRSMELEKAIEVAVREGFVLEFSCSFAVAGGIAITEGFSIFVTCPR